jgi:hypothetical protein
MTPDYEDVRKVISQTGAWVDAGPALQAMIDSGFIVEWKPEPGELDKPVAALALHIEGLVWDQLINKEKDE